MPRPLRQQFANATYHVTTRGNRRGAIYVDDLDRSVFIRRLVAVMKRYEWDCHAYCLMTTHYHLVVTTRKATIAAGMQQLNGQYAQSFNTRHRHVGHLFQGRYHDVVVRSDEQLLTLFRYVVRNPVRAGIVELATEWPWSSYAALVDGRESFVRTDVVLGLFDGRIAELRRFVETPEAILIARAA